MENEDIVKYVYCEEVVKGCPLINESKKHEFQYFLNKDYKGETFSFAERVLNSYCIDVDSVEDDMPGSEKRTVDLATGIASYHKKLQQLSSKRFLFVELKLGCDTVKHIDKDELSGKANHSRELFLSIGDVDSATLFIFNKNVAPQAKNLMSRWKNGAMSSIFRNWQVLSPEDYSNLICYTEDFPYIPKTDMSHICSQLEEMFYLQKYDSLYNFLCDIRVQAERFKQKYDIKECNYIAETVCRKIDLFVSDDIPSIEKELIMLLKEDFSALCN